MDYIMETVGLRKAYKDNIVVDDVNMHISKGAIYGFVGPNGAGKSTVMKMILSLIQPDAGEVQLLGEKVTSHSYEIFKKVGSIIENPYFYDKMTARQNLQQQLTLVTTAHFRTSFLCRTTAIRNI